MNRKYTFLLLLMVALSSFSLYAYEQHKEMDRHDVKFIKRQGEAWDKAGRIVGVLKNPPDDLIIEFYSGAQPKPVYIYKAPGQLNIYISKYLPHGTYKLTFKASGYADLIVRSVKVRPHSDTLLNIDFGTKVYTNR
jgi:hypothetical protein